MAERRAATTVKVAGMILTHKNDPNSHHTPGGGSGPTIKSGTVNATSAGTYPVSFTTAFPDANYAIELTCSNTSKGPVALWASKAAGGFDIIASQSGGGGFLSFNVDWIATAYNDP